MMYFGIETDKYNLQRPVLLHPYNPVQSQALLNNSLARLCSVSLINFRAKPEWHVLYHDYDQVLAMVRTHNANQPK